MISTVVQAAGALACTAIIIVHAHDWLVSRVCAWIDTREGE
ncbi:hypothetical protein [Novosphingobium sp. FKTRR1]|nr:hypothetical protein [Novosphingobium sp. FKTRR1]